MNTDPKTEDWRDDSAHRLEEFHRSLVPMPGNPNLQRLFTIHRERRVRRTPVIDTVVTYGAYEDPI